MLKHENISFLTVGLLTDKALDEGDNNRMANTYRADQVGSFLRPRAVLDAHVAHAAGTLELAKMRAIEDEAIRELLAMERETGISVLSDGELRRGSWAGDFQDAVDGYVEGTPAVSVAMQGGPAVIPIPGMAAGGMRRRVIGEKLRQRQRLTGHESAFVKANAAGRPYKVTMPAATYVVARAYNPEITSRAYATRAEVLHDAAQIIRGEIQALLDEGCPYIQLDNPHYPDYVVDSRRDAWHSVGVDPDQALAEDIAADNACLEGLNRGGTVLAMHLCRGNGGRGPDAPAGWHTEGGYDRIAEQLFTTLKVDRFLLEYDSDRAGTFEPLRFMPKGKMVVLGLVSTKLSELEPADAIVRRIEEAATFVPLEQLALSPQCGFASTAPGNPLTVDEQRRKLELVVEVAHKVWG